MGILNQALQWNFILVTSMISWLVAQVLKTIINCMLMRKVDISRMWGDGGWPSAHSATVCAMVAATARVAGMSSPIFSIAAVLAIITMHDAMGVRRQAGEQAKVLNQLIREWLNQGAQKLPFLGDKQLQEMVGHTPIEVISGAVVGLLVGSFMPMVV